MEASDVIKKAGRRRFGLRMLALGLGGGLLA